MESNISVIKGIHPGFILELELQKRQLAKGKFAISLNEFPQTLVAITKGKRRMNINLALKIEKALSLEEGIFMTLKVFYDVKEAKKKLGNQPDLTKFRTALFWDTNIEMIDWEKQKKAVIKRIFSRGDATEKTVITDFYGIEIINNVLNLTAK